MILNSYRHMHKETLEICIKISFRVYKTFSNIKGDLCKSREISLLFVSRNSVYILYISIYIYIYIYIYITVVEDTVSFLDLLNNYRVL